VQKINRKWKYQTKTTKRMFKINNKKKDVPRKNKERASQINQKPK